jgi:hypothetical protein
MANSEYLKKCMNISRKFDKSVRTCNQQIEEIAIVAKWKGFKGPRGRGLLVKIESVTGTLEPLPAGR